MWTHILFSEHHNCGSFSSVQQDPSLPPILPPDALMRLKADLDVAQSSVTKLAPLEAALTALLFSNCFGLCRLRDGTTETPGGKMPLMINGKLLWCDFLRAKKVEPLPIHYRADDLGKLAESILQSKGRKAPSVLELEQMVSLNPESYDDIAGWVARAMR